MFNSKSNVPGLVNPKFGLFRVHGVNVQFKKLGYSMYIEYIYIYIYTNITLQIEHMFIVYAQING